MNNHSLYKGETLMNKKTVIVTGGSSGMGKYMAKKFVEEGAQVVITDRTKEKLKNIKTELLSDSTGRTFTVQTDVRSAEDVERMVEQTVTNFGSIDQLVNNAAGNFICPAEDLSVNGWNSVIDIVL